MKFARSVSFNPSQQQGAALFVSLILLLVLTIVGLSAAQRSNMQERIAANTHMQHIVFNASESAIGGFLAEANTGNKLDPTHILYDLRINGTMTEQCFSENGTRTTCTGTYLDGDQSSIVQSKLNASVVDDCNTVMCGSFSLGRGTTRVGCRIFKVDGTGSIDSTTSNTSLWAYEITACSN